MAKLLGVDYTKQDLLKYCGNISQIASITESRLSEGKADEMRSYSVKTGSGLEFTVLPGKCLDISSVTYKGINISYLAKPGIVTSSYGYPVNGEFGSYFSGGMLYTCGLLNVGSPCVDEGGNYHPPHGKIGISPAESSYSRCFWDNNDYILEIGGTVTEAALFKHNLSLTRKISTRLGSNEIIITDELENKAPQAEEFMLLYHFNFGFPFIDYNTNLIFPDNIAVPHTEDAKSGFSESEMFIKPSDKFSEHLFSRDIKPDAEGNVTVRLENENLKSGLYLKYEKENLSNFIQWKSMKSSDYVLGLEPCNCFINGRSEERANGTIKKINPYSTIKYNLTLGFYEK